MVKCGKQIALTRKEFYVLFNPYHNSGYMGLYSGATAGDIKHRKGLKGNKEIFDHVNSEELPALKENTKTLEKKSKERE